MSDMGYDTTLATEEVRRDASNPTVESLPQVKRTARFLKGRPNFVLSVRWVDTERSHVEHFWTVIGKDVRKADAQFQAGYRGLENAH